MYGPIVYDSIHTHTGHGIGHAWHNVRVLYGMYPPAAPAPRPALLVDSDDNDSNKVRGGWLARTQAPQRQQKGKGVYLKSGGASSLPSQRMAEPGRRLHNSNFFVVKVPGTYPRAATAPQTRPSIGWYSACLWLTHRFKHERKSVHL